MCLEVIDATKLAVSDRGEWKKYVVRLPEYVKHHNGIKAK